MLEKFLQKLEFKGYSQETIKVYRYYLKDKVERILKGEIDEGWFSENLITRANQIHIINSFIVFANENGFNIARVEPVKIPQKELRVLDYNKILKYVEQLPENGFERLRNKIILLIFVKTGIRASELLNLKMSDLDIEQRCLYVKGKGNKERRVWLSNGVLDLLNKYINERDKIAKCDYLFITARGEKMSRTLVYEIVKSVLKKIGVEKKLGPHHLRHAFASHLARKVNPFVLQKILGHSNLNTTLKYVHNLEEQIKLAMEGL